MVPNPPQTVSLTELPPIHKSNFKFALDLACECLPGYARSAESADQFLPVCSKCPSGTPARSFNDPTSCVSCSGSATFNDFLQDCTCPENFIVVESGNQKTCQACDPSAYAGPATNRVVTECQRCPQEGQSYNKLRNPWVCECDSTLAGAYSQAGDMCYFTSVTAPLAADSKQIEYRAVETRNKNDGTLNLQSGIMSFYYTQAVVGCETYGQPKACQMIANLCVLNLYKASADACKKFKEITDSKTKQAHPEFYPDDGWKEDLPWLYYDRPSDDVITEDKRVKFRASFSYENLEIGVVKRLRFKIATYTYDGEFTGFSDLDDQLVLCPQPTEELQRLFDIGTTVEFSCTYDLSGLVSLNKFEVPRKANRFYELFLVDYNGDLIDVPVKIENVISPTGDEPNMEEDMSQWILTRRFFMFDTISGISTEDWPNGAPTVIRYPKRMVLKINLDLNNEEMIDVPYLQIRYAERTNAYIQENSLTDISFESEYFMSTEGFWRGAGAIFWVFFGIFVLIMITITFVQIGRPSL